MPALMNAVMDALRSAGVAQFDMPATPRRVWQALQANRTREGHSRDDRLAAH
jgi:carbon-monoxide dehydrogenase large subunit